MRAETTDSPLNAEKTEKNTEKTVNNTEKTLNKAKKTLNNTEKTLHIAEKTLHKAEKTSSLLLSRLTGGGGKSAGGALGSDVAFGGLGMTSNGFVDTATEDYSNVSENESQIRTIVLFMCLRTLTLTLTLTLSPTLNT